MFAGSNVYVRPSHGAKVRCMVDIEAIDLDKFVTICIDTLNNHAPSKKKFIRDNHLPFMNKELSKEIMRRTQLRNNFFEK